MNETDSLTITMLWGNDGHVVGEMIGMLLRKLQVCYRENHWYVVGEMLGLLWGNGWHVVEKMIGMLSGNNWYAVKEMIDMLLGKLLICCYTVVER